MALYRLFWPVGVLGLALLLPWVRRHAWRFFPSVTALLLLSYTDHGREPGQVYLSERSFYGHYSVVGYDGGAWRGLQHGRTSHGFQGSGHLSNLPTTYFHPAGPIGRVMAALRVDPRLDNVGVVGLGIGSLAAYAMPGQTWTFFELDAGILRVAMNPAWFTFLKQAHERSEPERPVDLRFVIGDGRQTLGGIEDGRFGLLVLDAFSSDSIPVHLLTSEAVALYLRKLKPGGILAFHISNQHVDLLPVCSAIASDLGLEAVYWFDESPARRQELQQASLWVVMGVDQASLASVVAASSGASFAPADLESYEGEIPADEGLSVWRPLPPSDRRDLWTDDHVDLIRAMSRPRRPL